MRGRGTCQWGDELVRGTEGARGKIHDTGEVRSKYSSGGGGG